jgi:hypothetical protein
MMSSGSKWLPTTDRLIQRSAIDEHTAQFEQSSISVEQWELFKNNYFFFIMFLSFIMFFDEQKFKKNQKFTKEMSKN